MQNEEPKKNVFENIPKPIFKISNSGQVLSSNSATKDFLNLKDGDYLEDIIPALDSVWLNDCIKQSTSSNKEITFNEKYFNFLAICEADGILILVDNITEYRLTEQRLQDSKSFLRKVIDTDPNLIFVKDSKGKFVLANKQVAKIYGTSTQDIIGKTDADFNENPEEVNVFVTDDQFVINHKRDLVIKEEKVTDANGNEVWLETLKLPIRTIDGETQVLGISTDISKKKILQEQLFQSQKMEAVGQLAGGIAHDFNNLLTGIMGYTSLLLSSESIDPQIAHATEMIQSAAEKAAHLTQQLLAFARKGKHQNIPIDLHQLISETVNLLARTLEKNIYLKKELLAEHKLVMGDPVQIQQIILNLAINARDAMTQERGGSNGGELKVKTEIVTVNSLKSYELGVNEGDYICLTVRDTGCGIKEENLTRIFDPFFTTKAPEQGSGMGLAMLYGIVNNHEGSVKVASQVNVGTEFKVYLPLIKEKVLAKSIEKIHYRCHGRGHILLVDDHSLIREVTTKMLTSLGYDVVTAKDGIEALQYYKQNYKLVDLIILDMVMPRMGAKECFKEFKNINPHVRAILSTGYVNNNSVQNILNDGMIGFVQKPYHLNSLSRVISEALSESPLVA